MSYCIELQLSEPISINLVPFKFIFRFAFYETPIVATKSSRNLEFQMQLQKSVLKISAIVQYVVY